MEKNTKNLESIAVANANLRLAQADLRDAVIRSVLDGASWQEVGETLGVSKQTAHNRYAHEVELTARYEAGEVSQVTAEQAESILSDTYNPVPRLDINLDRDRNYRRTLRQ